MYNFLLDCQYQDLNISNKPVKELSDKIYANNIIFYKIFFISLYMFVIPIAYFVYSLKLI